MKHTCRWIKEAAKVGKEAVYCGKPVKYKMVLDDDDNKVRKYNSFCKEHQKQVDEMEKDD